jgi:predicted dehydrogenase
MGKAHSNAYLQAPRFFPLRSKLALQVACGRHRRALDEFASNWGWRETETSWEKLIQREDIDLVDIASPTYTHKNIAIAAAQAGKHILLEKPMALNADEGRQMLEAVTQAGVKHAIGFNYRPSPPSSSRRI